MPRKGKKKFLQLTAIAVWALLAAALFVDLRLAAKDGATLLLKTEPDSVKIQLDGKPMFDGAYMQTPLDLKLPRGRHTLKLSRDGYEAYRLTIEAAAGQNYDVGEVQLSPKSDADFIRVDLVLAEDSKPVDIVAVINDGQMRAKLPFQAKDLARHGTHDIEFFMVGKERRPLLRCRYKRATDSTPPKPEALDEADDEKALIEFTYLAANSLRIEGCRRLKVK